MLYSEYLTVSKQYLVALGILLFCHSVGADIFKWVDADGDVHFTDSPPKDTKIKKVTVKINSYEFVKVVPSKNKVATIKKANPQDKNITMYSAQWCGVCRKAKRYFKQKGIAYKEYDIDKSKEAKLKYKELNARGIPVIFIDDTRLNGFSIAQFEQVYYH